MFAKPLQQTVTNTSHVAKHYCDVVKKRCHFVVVRYNDHNNKNNKNKEQFFKQHRRNAKKQFLRTHLLKAEMLLEARKVMDRRDPECDPCDLECDPFWKTDPMAVELAEAMLLPLPMDTADNELLPRLQLVDKPSIPCATWHGYEDEWLPQFHNFYMPIITPVYYPPSEPTLPLGRFKLTINVHGLSDSQVLSLEFPTRISRMNAAARVSSMLKRKPKSLHLMRNSSPVSTDIRVASKHFRIL